MSFHVKFNIKDYDDVTPTKEEIAEMMEHDYVINEDQYEKGNIDKCIWQKHKPTYAEMMSQEYQLQEVTRIKKGAWIAIKEDLVYLPPSYYLALQYGKSGGEDLQFRLNRLKHCYFKIRARNNPYCKGTFTIKPRQAGDTTMSIIDAFWQTLEMEDSQIGIQSKTRNDAINPCWKTMQSFWMNLPVWLKKALWNDFASGSNIAETMKFMREADDEKGIAARNVLIAYYPAVFNAMDGKNNVTKVILDEVCKWVECSFGDTLINYSKFIMPGRQRRGMFDIISSPADKECASFKEAYDLWLKSDPEQLDKNGITQSGIYRYAADTLEGVQGFYDKYGDADPNEIYDWVMQQRKAVPKDKVLAEIRGFPLNDEERWGSLEGGDFWDNGKGINDRKIYLLGTRFKDNETQEPTTVYGNLEWRDGIKDTEVVFRQSDKVEFEVGEARFSFSYMPKNVEDLPNIFNPPILPENVLGIDSVDKRYPGKRASDVGMINYKFRDFFDTGIVKCPTMIYSNRPTPVEIAYEDAIKAAVFNRAPIQVESANLNIVNYGEDRGYIKWFLSKRGQPKNSLMKGDMPSGKSAFIDEIVGLINAVTNVPLTGEQYNLLLWWHYELLQDISVFNKKDTHANHLSMCLGQALLGASKLLFEKKRPSTGIGTAILNQLF